MKTVVVAIRVELDPEGKTLFGPVRVLDVKAADAFSRVNALLPSPVIRQLCSGAHTAKDGDSVWIVRECELLEQWRP